MLARLKFNSSATNCNKSDKRNSVVAQQKPKSASPSQEKQSAKLKKRKLPQSVIKEEPVTTPDTTSPTSSTQPLPTKAGADFASLPSVAPRDARLAKAATPTFSVFETEFRPTAVPKAETTISDEEITTPDRQALPIYDLRRDNSPTTIVFKGDETGIEKEVGSLIFSSNTSNSNSRKLNRASTESHPSMPRKLVKKPPSDTSGASPLSAIKRRFTYTAGITGPSTIEEEISEADIRRLSIQATRSPEFSPSSDSSKPVPVTIVDSLPHQKSSSPTRNRVHRRLSSVPSTIAESEVNEEFLLEQEEVLSYLQNSLLAPPSPLHSLHSLNSDGGLPNTPPPNQTSLSRQDSIAKSTRSFVGSMVAEFPYLFGDDPTLPVPETEPLQPKISTDLYGLGLHAATTTSLPLPHRPTEFPPSPPQSERQASIDTSRAILDELASESTSMRSVVDAINRAASPRSSFDYTDYDNESIYEEPPEFDIPRPMTLGIEGDAESVYEFSAPVLRNGRALQDIDDAPSLFRNDSVGSRATEFEDTTPLAQIIAEKRRAKPSLAPLVITPIAPGQYGPPLQRRQHFRGRSRIGSPQSAKFKDKPKPTLVKVVEEEVVEYTPIEEGEEKGWMKQRRVSRGGDWVVVEREILSQSAI
jgi:hypothetical protein